jgi:ethanolamine ammonia-lyase large subunit
MNIMKNSADFVLSNTVPNAFAKPLYALKGDY